MFKRHAIAGLTATVLSIAPLAPGFSRPILVEAATDEAVAFQQNSLHDGFQPGDPITPPLARRWDRDLGGVVSYPLIAGGHIFVTVANTGAYPNFNYGATLHGMDEGTGQDLWPPVAIASSSYWSSATYDNGLVFASGTNDLYAVEPSTGAVRWRKSLPNTNAPISAHGGTVFVATQGDARAFHESDGSPAWPQAQVLENDGGTGGPTVTTSGVYVDYACQNIYDLNPADGSVVWTTVNSAPCHGGGGSTSPIHDGRLYAQGPPGPTQSPTIYDAASGQTLGTYQADLNEAFDGDTALYSYGSTLRAQDLATGSTRWSFNGDCDLLSAPVVANGYVYVGSTQGHIYAVNESTGQAVWQDTVGGPIIDPQYEGAPVGGLAIGEGLLAVPAFHHLVLFAPGAGGAAPAGPGADAVASYPPSGLTGQPQWLAKGPDGNIWATEFSGVVAPFHNRIARVTPAGVVTEFEVSSTDNRDLTGITAGSDGALWFTEQAASKVGRITTGGQITEYSLPTVFPGYGTSYPPEPYGITSGPDGALWITLAGFNQVARITTAGVLTNQFQLPGDPPGSEQPHGITTGPDGNIWFTEAQGQKIGRLTASGILTEFPLPTITAAESPEGIATGPDNNLWFTVPGNPDPHAVTPPPLRKIGRVTTSGTFTYFDAPTPWSSPWGITVGPDGALWFTEHRAFGHTPEKVGRMTTTGVAREVWVPGGAQLLSGIVTGADGNLWFGQSSLNRIDQLDPRKDPCPSSPAAVTPSTFYFAEGFTGSGFAETLSLFMPHTSGTATIVYDTASGLHLTRNAALSTGIVTQVDVNAAVGPDQQVSARVTLPGPGVAERTMHFTSGQWHGSTDKVGAAATATLWDFAEGSTLPAFSEYLTVQNPNPTPVAATLSYFTDTGLHPVKTLNLPASSRTTVEVFNGSTADATSCVANGPGANCGVGRGIGGVSASVTATGPIIAERAVYVNDFSFGAGPIGDGHVAFGATAAARTWNFAEGTTLTGFNEYLTLQNANAAAATVDLNYFTDTGATPAKTLSVPANRRVTIEVFHGDLSNNPSCTAGANGNCGVGPGIGGVSVNVTSRDQPIVAERPVYMYVNFGTGVVAGAHVVVGANALGRSFGFAWASTQPSDNDYLTVQNPGDTAANLTARYYLNSGQVTKTFVVNPHSRTTVEIFRGDLTNSTCSPAASTCGVGPNQPSIGIVVSSDQPVLTEKLTYSSSASTYGATGTLGHMLPSF